MIALFVLGALSLTTRPASAEEFGPDLQVNSKHYIVIDADTGEVFASRDADEQVAMASLTKVFTAIQALEDGSLDQEIVTDESDLMDATNSTMDFSPGEVFTLEDLLYGLMLPSGNDAAHAIARELGYEPGDSDEEAVERFVARTNQRIKDAGLTDTNLVNPSGYGVPGHYTTAHDLAVWMMYALKYPTFETLISTLEFTTTTGQYLRNNNRLMGMGYEPLVGGKTGFDNDAGWCLIEVARRDGNTMISVTLDGIAPDDWYDDNRVLLNYALDAKAEREAGDRPINGPTVAFLDPDAAVISRFALGGGSIGGSARLASGSGGPSVPTTSAGAPVTNAGSSDTSPTDPADLVADETFSNPSATRIGGSDVPIQETWVVVGVAMLVIVARGLGAFSSPLRRTRLPDLPPSDRLRSRRHRAPATRGTLPPAPTMR